MMRIKIWIVSVGIQLTAGCNSETTSQAGAQAGAANASSDGGFTVVDPSSPHRVELVAAQVIGGSVETGSGYGELRIDRQTGAIQGTITLDGISAAEVTLNRGHAGEIGPVVVGFDNVGGNDWSLPPSSALTAKDIEEMDTGGLYVTVASAKSPGGAVRGQVVRSGAVGVAFFTGFGSQVIPATRSAATASVAVTTSSAVMPTGIVGQARDVELHVNLHALDDVSAVHVHQALAGENGPVVAELVQDPADPMHWFSRQALFDDDAILAFERGYCSNGSCDPRLYVDVHTAANPGGELRAQLGHRTTVQFVALTADDVVPGVPSAPAGMVGVTITDIVGWDWTFELTMHANLHGLDEASAVTLNYGPVGQNGPAVYSLQRDPNRADHWFGRTLLNEPVSHAAFGWYFSVSTPEFPDGQLRGQWDTQINGWLDEGFRVTGIDPADGLTVNAWPAVITVEFNQEILASSAGTDTVRLMASGGDARFDDGNEWQVTPVSVTANGATLSIVLSELADAKDFYQLNIGELMAAEAPLLLKPRVISTFEIDPAHPSPTFARLQQEIFTPGCAQGGCHSGPRAAFGLDLSAGNALGNIVNVASNEAPDIDLVEPGDPEASYILSKLFRPWWNAHPAGQARLSNASLQRLRQWIDEGAQAD